jgi:hypothetical protein
MDAQKKAKWVEALRSGKYNQGMGRLRSGDRYCCMGVLCDVVIDGKWDPFKSRDILGGQRYQYCTHTGDSFGSSLNNAALDEVGLSGEEENTLINMNDIQRCDFERIAAHIEENL